MMSMLLQRVISKMPIAIIGACSDCLKDLRAGSDCLNASAIKAKLSQGTGG